MRDLDPPPSDEERVIVAELFMHEQVLIGSVDEIWTHRDAPRLLTTVRRAIRGIAHLHRVGRVLGPSRLIATMESFPYGPDEDDPPFMGSDAVKYLLTDGHALLYWAKLMPDRGHPHSCPRCGAPAYIGLTRVECKLCGDF